MKKKNGLLIFLNISLTIVFFFSYFNSKNIVLLFALNFILVLEIVFKCKLSLFSLKSLIINYILFPLLYQYIYGESYGLLELNASSIHYPMILLSIFLYNITTFLFLNLSEFKKEELRKLQITYKLKDTSVLVLCIFTIICCIIAFPTIPFSYNAAHRFDALLPGNAWNHIVLICLIFLLGNLKTNKTVVFTYLFSCFWFLSHYERVDMLGLISLLLLIYFAKKNIKLHIVKVIKMSAIVIILFIIMINVGYNRGGYKADNILKNIFVQSTAADIAYVYNISLDYNMNNDLLYGNSYKQLIIESIPLLNYKNSIPRILEAEYVFPGGEYLLSAPVMNFGLIFVPIFTIIENFILLKIIKSKNNYLYIVYLFIVASSFRINWYGLTYIETGLLYIIPLLLFIYRNIFSSLVFEGDCYG